MKTTNKTSCKKCARNWILCRKKNLLNTWWSERMKFFSNIINIAVDWTIDVMLIIEVIIEFIFPSIQLNFVCLHVDSLMSDFYKAKHFVNKPKLLLWHINLKSTFLRNKHDQGEEHDLRKISILYIEIIKKKRN